MTASHSRPFLAAVAAIGFALALAWQLFALPLADTIETDSFAVLAVLFYGVVYAPLIVLALVLGWICSVRGWAAGRASPAYLAAAFALGLLAPLLAAGLGWLNGGLTPGQAAAPGKGGAVLLLGALLLLFQIAAEELLLRGWLLQTLRGAFGSAAATGLTALAFAGWTMAGAPLAVLPALNLILLGLVLALAADRFDGIAVTVAARFGWTIAADLVLGINPNPGTGPFGAWVDLDLTGGALWGGSEAGLAHSLGTSAVLLAILLPLAARGRRPGQAVPA